MGDLAGLYTSRPQPALLNPAMQNNDPPFVPPSYNPLRAASSPNNGPGGIFAARQRVSKYESVQFGERLNMQ